MAPVYTVRFAMQRIAVAGYTAVYTVPAGMRAVLRNIDVGNSEQQAGTVYMLPNGAAVIWGYDFVRGVESAQWEGRCVVEAGETMYFQLSDAGPYDVQATGYLFSA